MCFWVVFSCLVFVPKNIKPPKILKNVLNLGFCSQVELSVVSVLMVPNAVCRYDISHRAAIDGEQQRSEYRTLRYSDFQYTSGDWC